MTIVCCGKWGEKRVEISETSHIAAKVAFYLVILCWWVFGLTFWLRKSPAKAREAKRDNRSLLGLLLQAAGYCLVWFFPLQHGRFALGTFQSSAAEWALAIVTVMMAVASVWLVNTA